MSNIDKRPAVYSQEFYNTQFQTSIRSAKVIIPLILDLIEPKSVLDVGCGVGSWLKVFQDFGITDFFGIDGPWVQESQLLIPKNNFGRFDLSKPLDLNRSFNLVYSLEVAEHLPKDFAKTFVDSLVKHSSIVVFSAAVPGQGGTDHVNEQWPEYWQEIFSQKGYQVVDCFRDQIWKNTQINYWYRQNILVFVRKSEIAKYPKLQNYLAQNRPLSRVHTEMLTHKLSYNEIFNLLKVKLTFGFFSAIRKIPILGDMLVHVKRKLR